MINLTQPAEAGRGHSNYLRAAFIGIVLVLATLSVAARTSHIRFVMFALLVGVVLPWIFQWFRRWRWKAVAVAALMFPVAFILLGLLMIGFGGWHSYSPPMSRPAYSVPMDVKIRLIDGRMSWQSEETMSLPKSFWKEVLTLPIPVAPGSEVTEQQRADSVDALEWRQEAIALLTESLAHQGWTMSGYQDNMPIYYRRLSVKAQLVEASLLFQTYRLQTQSTWLGPLHVSLVADSSSHLYLTTPRGAITVTDPPTDIKPVPSGDRLIFDSFGSVELTVLRPAFRNTVLRGIAILPGLPWFGWVLFVGCAVIGMFAKDWLQWLLTRGVNWARRSTRQAKPAELPRSGRKSPATVSRFARQKQARLAGQKRARRRPGVR